MRVKTTAAMAKKLIYNKLGYSENRARHRSHQLRYKFGITIEDYNRILDSQGGTCAICDRKNSTRKKGTHNKQAIPMALSVDHDHKTGKIRGLLCNGCNTCLGRFRDDPALFEKAIEYLKK
jgi:hypothetical protein